MHIKTRVEGGRIKVDEPRDAVGLFVPSVALVTARSAAHGVNSIVRAQEQASI